MLGKNQCPKTPLTKRGEVQASLQFGERGGLLQAHNMGI